jgi:hypothetical protein
MESDIDKSRIDTKLLENLSLTQHTSLPTFKKKSIVQPQNIKSKLRVVSNFITLNPEKDVKFYLYTITIEGCFKEDVKHALLRAFRLNQDVRKHLQDNFSFFQFTGQGMFCMPRGTLNDRFVFYIRFGKNVVEIITEETYQNEREATAENLFLVTMERKYTISTENQLLNEDNPDISRQVLNIYFKTLLKDNNYTKSNTGIYFKVKSNESRFYPEEYVPVGDDYKKMFVKGYKLTSLVNDKNVPLLRINTRYRLLHNKTFLDVFKEDLRENLKAFKEFCLETRGVKFYGNEEIRKFDDVLYTKPSNLTFYHKKHGDINVLKYMFLMYGYDNDSEQPILVKMSKQYVKEIIDDKEVKKEIEIPLYFPAKCMYVAGNLPNQEKVNLNNCMKMDVSSIFESTLNIIEDLKRSQVGLKYQVHSNFLPLQVGALLLKKPVLEFKEGQDVQPGDDGQIISKNKTARDTPSKLDYVIVYNRDINKDKVLELTCRLYEESQVIMPGILADRARETIALNHSVRDSESAVTSDMQVRVFDLLRRMEENDKIAKVESKVVIFFLLYDKDESYYKLIKTLFNMSKLKSQSQILTVKKIINKNTSVYTNIFFQVLAKFSYAPWRFRPINREIQQRTIIITYSVGLGVISLSYSLNSDFTKNYFIQKRYDVKSKYLCQDVGYYFDLALKDFAARISKPRDIDNIIIYREGLNRSQLLHFDHYELSLIKTKLMEIKQSTNPKVKIFANAEICVLIVYPDNDTRLFLLRDQSGVEVINKYNIENNPVGLFINNSLVLKDKQEFYLVSSYNSILCNNPTKYQIFYDNTGLELDFIYNVTFALTFLYYNNNKSIKVPAALHLCNRRNARFRLLNQEWLSPTPSISY